ncbi:MAG TPA: winged helix DNA-binding domain-containing protein [Jiangellaceae bacterium]|nr:winged helix DNA-binding domain-containing protein [Jiangellaceae bacterium]
MSNVQHRMSVDEVRRRLLKKQKLTDDGAADVVAVCDDLVGLHATGTTSPYLQVFARLPGFRRADLEDALYRDRSLARVRCMRGTVFIVSRSMLPIVMAATRRIVEPLSTRFLASVGVTENEYLALAARIEAVLDSSDHALTAGQLRQHMRADQSLSRVVNLMCDQGRLVRDRPVGSWKSRTFTYRRFHDAVPNIVPIAEDEAVRQIASLYIRSYGPVTLSDLAWWSGLGLRPMQQVVEELGDVVQIDIDGNGSVWLAHTDDLATIISPDIEPTAPVVRLLPELDPFLMGRYDRHLFFDQAFVDYITDRAGNVTSTVMIDGRVVGVWDVAETPTPAVGVHLFDPEQPGYAQVHEQAARVAQFWFNREVPIVEVSTMPSLKSRSAGGFLSPLAKDNTTTG